MKRILYILMATLLLAVGCNKKEKQFIPLSGITGDNPITQSSGSGGGTASTNVTGATLTQITVSPTSQSIAQNTYANYTATGVYSDGTIKTITSEVTWSVGSGTDKASVDSTKGRFLGSAATSSESPAKVRASFESISGEASLIITSAVTLTAIQVTSVPSLTPGGTTQYVATGIFSDGSTQDVSSLVTWSSSDASSVTIDPVTGTAVGGNSSGTATITATLTSPTTFPSVPNNGVATTNTEVKVVTIVSITITGASSVNAGSSSNYSASAIYSDGTSADVTSQVTWSVSNSSNAAVNDSTGSKGVLTTISGGSVTVQATLSGVTGSKTVTISDATVTSVTVSPSTKSIPKGTSTQFTATAAYSDGTSRDVTNSAVWSSSNTSAAGVNTSTTTGGLSQGVGTGSATITATIGGVSGSASLTVTAATLVSISINANATIAKGTTKQYTATGMYSDGSTLDITSSVSWSSTSTSNVSISNGVGTKGLATGVAQGSSTIQASLNGINSTTSTLSISAATLDSIAIDGNSSLQNGLTKQYTATGTYSDGSTQDITTLVTWSSETPATATISNANGNNGKASSIAVGTSNITASLPNGTNGIITTSGGTVISNSSVLTITVASTTTKEVGAYDVTIPTGINTTTTPTGNFSGITYNTANNAAGFISVTPDYTTNPNTCQAQGTAVLAKIAATSPITASTLNSTTTTNFSGGCTISYNLSITTSTSKKATELSDLLIASVGVNTNGGSVSNLPTSQGTETATTSFRAIAQVTYKIGDGGQIIGIGVTNSADYATNQALLESFLGGTNVASKGTVYLVKTDSTTGKAEPKVDFVWVVDNSSSMSQEQTAVSNAASTFFSKLSSKHLDYRLGVIATGGTGSKSCNTPTASVGTTGNLRGEDLRAAGWVTSSTSNPQATFTGTSGTTVGTDGCGTESGIFFASRSIGGNGGTATVTPRAGQSDWGSDYKLVFIVVSDESDQYACYSGNGTTPSYTSTGKDSNPPCPSGTSLNYSTSKFKEKGAAVYSIIGLNASTGLPGTCTATGVSASNGNNVWTGYYDLSNASGGGVASICSSDYSSIMDTIVNSVAGSSGYILSKNPQSSSISVKVGGVTVPQSSTDGWQYISSSNSIVFAGDTYWPASGVSIEITYQYTSDQGAFLNSQDNNLMAYVSKTANSDTARGAAAAIALLVGAILAGRIWRNSKKNN